MLRPGRCPIFRAALHSRAAPRLRLQCRRTQLDARTPVVKPGHYARYQECQAYEPKAVKWNRRIGHRASARIRFRSAGQM
jgi:hypothetical protein